VPGSKRIGRDPARRPGPDHRQRADGEGLADPELALAYRDILAELVGERVDARLAA